ncbi:vWA domain-containing protein [Trichococcus pasteurii]|uniref:von willebrand factor type a n=1 Tax=Trichococcus pasteurii TaxID=43064 RepID=A0A1W1IFK9_9LACT|nr:vWA domain-containing protein [Trichococcus pasteurii]SFE45769.1 von Willebrand factor type A domain-containing protein [Trichococcus pasteurii]SLM51679.1 von willebrand factor type a [Trichococcus pasteurii]SSB92560.1 von willebrand factor type a [Trichococcus pasteurii]
MRAKNAFVLVFLSIFIGWITLPGYATAETTASERIAVALVIDTSGSMAETDPNHLRKTAADIFVDMLSPEDHVGIVSFATEATELVPMQQVGDTANKQTIKNTLASITEVNGNTNYRAALEKAEEQLESIDDPAVRKVILFLTDGVPEPDYAQREDTVFMTAYMDSVWETTARLGQKDIAVYPLGFGTVDTSILQRIATDTRGEAKFLGSAGDIAVNFVDVLRTLKNRQGFWNESVALSGESVVPFQVDGYTSQVTMAVTYDTAGTDVFIRPVNSEAWNDRISIQKNEQYSILTMNQTEEELAGDWELVITGTGNAQLFGDKDLTLKSWMISPQANTQVPMDEPIDLVVEVDGELSDEMAVQGVVSKNGAVEFETIPLILEKGQYVGTYENVDQGGSYILETQIISGETVITSSSVSVSVQQLPVLKSDQELDGDIFKIGESQTLTGYLELDDQLLDGSQRTVINSMNLVATYSDGRQEIIPMQDAGPESGADETAGDGVYTAELPLSEEGDYSVSLVAQGTTPQGNFTLEEDSGDYRVISVGAVSGKVTDEALYTKPGSVVSVPVQLKNDSKRSETIQLSVEAEDAVAKEQSLTLEPGETSEMDIVLALDDSAPLGAKSVSITMQAEDSLTQTQSFGTEIQLFSGSAYFQKKTLDFMTKNGLFVGVLVSLPIVIIALGRLIYVLKLKQALSISRSFVYAKADDPENAQEWLLPKKVDTKLIVLGGEDKEAVLSLEGAKIPYRMIVKVETSPARFKCWEGYRTLSKTYIPVHIKIETTPPGIFKLDGEVHTNKEIFDQDAFESGGYRFIYKAEKSLAEETKARNVLEGKM